MSFDLSGLETKVLAVLLLLQVVIKYVDITTKSNCSEGDTVPSRLRMPKNIQSDSRRM